MRFLGALVVDSSRKHEFHSLYTIWICVCVCWVKARNENAFLLQVFANFNIVLILYTDLFFSTGLFLFAGCCFFFSWHEETFCEAAIYLFIFLLCEHERTNDSRCSDVGFIIFLCHNSSQLFLLLLSGYTFHFILSDCFYSFLALCLYFKHFIPFATLSARLFHWLYKDKWISKTVSEREKCYCIRSVCVCVCMSWERVTAFLFEYVVARLWSGPQNWSNNPIGIVSLNPIEL